MPTINTAQNPGAILKLGSGIIYGKEVKPDGTDLTVADTFHVLGILKQGVYDKKSSVSKESDEGGNKYKTGKETEAVLDLTFLQREKADLDLPETLENTWVTIVKELNKTAISSKYQYLVTPLCQSDGGIQIDGANIMPKCHFDCQPAPAAITVAMTGVTGSGGAVTGNATIPKGRYHTIFEFTPA